MDKLSIVFNGTPELEYDRNKPLQDQQLLHLDKMDEKMDAGITIGDQHIVNPDKHQRAQFIAANLAHAMKANEEPTMASLMRLSCDAYARCWKNHHRRTRRRNRGGFQLRTTGGQCRAGGTADQAKLIELIAQINHGHDMRHARHITTLVRY